MPVILPREHHPVWLQPEELTPEQLAELLVPHPADAMEAYAVSTRVNKPAHDDPACLERVPNDRLF
jgi:putative SOS response-associated peptidase YedK